MWLLDFSHAWLLGSHWNHPKTGRCPVSIRENNLYWLSMRGDSGQMASLEIERPTRARRIGEAVPVFARSAPVTDNVAVENSSSTFAILIDATGEEETVDRVEGGGVLLLVGPSLHSTLNNRAHHLTYHARRIFPAVDVVTHISFYEGPPTNVFKKAFAGITAFVHDRKGESTGARGTEITFRGIALPFHLKALVNDLWFYAYLRQTCRKHYRICIFCDPRIALMAVLLRRSGMVDTLLYEDWDYFPVNLPVARNRFGSLLLDWRERVAVRSADLVIYVSQPLAKLRQEQGAGRVEVVPNGVNYDLFAQAELKPAHPPTLIYMGTLSQPWGADLPIRALPTLRKSIPNLRYIMVGPRADESGFRNLATDLGVQDLVMFVGAKP